MVNGISGSSNSAAAQDSSGTTQAAKQDDALANKDTFLKLLVAQIRNQDPLQPNDGLQFVTQLAQFSGLEQSMEIRTEVEAIHKLLEAKAVDASQGSAETGQA